MISSTLVDGRPSGNSVSAWSNRPHLLKILACLITVPVWARCQARIIVPRPSFKVSEQIAAKITNIGHQQISYCVEFGQWSAKELGADGIEATPIPFYVQRKSAGKWSTLPLGPDIGSLRKSALLQPGESHEFPFRLSNKGQMRLLLAYWIGKTDLNCENLPQGEKKTRSKSFFVW